MLRDRAETRHGGQMLAVGSKAPEVTFTRCMTAIDDLDSLALLPEL